MSERQLLEQGPWQYHWRNCPSFRSKYQCLWTLRERWDCQSNLPQSYTEWWGLLRMPALRDGKLLVLKANFSFLHGQALCNTLLHCCSFVSLCLTCHLDVFLVFCHHVENIWHFLIQPPCIYSSKHCKYRVMASGARLALVLFLGKCRNAVFFLQSHGFLPSKT